MYIPNFTITQSILKNIGTTEACKEVIITAPLIPAWEKKFQTDAVARTIHHATHLEGNDLSYTQAKRVMEGKKVTAKSRDIQEVINYRRVLKYISSLNKKSAKNKTFKYSPKLLKKIHKLVTAKILKTQLTGKFRKKQVVVKEGASGKKVFSPPKPNKVKSQIKDFFNWINTQKARTIHPVLRAGISHFELVRIHPFIDGNGRVTRAFANLVLFVEGYDINRLFSLEEHFDKDIVGYYQALESVEKRDGNLTRWLEYFAHCLAIELTQVKNRIKKLSLDDKFKDKLGRQIALSERQVKLIEYLKKHQYLRMNEAKKIIPKVSEDTILRDLKDLMKKGIVRKKGKTKAAKYLLAS